MKTPENKPMDTYSASYILDTVQRLGTAVCSCEVTCKETKETLDALLEYLGVEAVTIPTHIELVKKKK